MGHYAAYGHPPVLARVHCQRMASDRIVVACANVLGLNMSPGRDGELVVVGHRLHSGHVDVLALAARITPVKCGHHRIESVYACRVLRLKSCTDQRLSVRLARLVHLPGEGIAHHGVALVVLVWAGLPEIRDGSQHDSRVDRLQDLVAETLVLHCPRSVSLHDNVNGRQERLERLNAGSCAQVEGDALLVGV